MRSRWLSALTLAFAWSASAFAQTKEEKKPAEKPAAQPAKPDHPTGKSDHPKAPTAAAKPAAQPADQDPHAAIMEAYVKAAQPGPEHAKLKSLEGSWTTVTKSWHDAASAPEESKGTREAKWIMDGRFLEEHYTGEFQGMKFQGMGIAGYDNVQKKYVTAWLDNFGTGIMVFTGAADGSGKTFTYTGEYADPITGKMTKMRTVNRVIDDKTFVFEMYGPDETGKEFKMMEIVHTKK